MSTHSVVEARTRLSDLIDRARQGEPIVITRRGKAVAELRPVQSQVRRLTSADLEWLDAHRVMRRDPQMDAGALISRMRDEEQR